MSPRMMILIGFLVGTAFAFWLVRRRQVDYGIRRAEIHANYTTRDDI